MAEPAKIRRYSARLSRIIVLLFNKLITKLVTFLCGISPHLVRSGDISLFVCIREPRVCDVWERTLGMSV